MLGRRNKMDFNQPHLLENPYPYDPSFWFGYSHDVRQQPLPYPYAQPYAVDWQNPYMGYPQGAMMNPQMGPQWNQPYMNPGSGNEYSKMLFQNPLQPQVDPIYGQFHPQQDYQVANPYPQQAFLPKQPSGLQSVMNSFKSQDGHLDFNKMVDTAGQMVNAVTQVSSLVKGLGGMFKV